MLTLRLQRSDGDVVFAAFKAFRVVAAFGLQPVRGLLGVLLSVWLNTPGGHKIAFVAFSVCRGEVFAGRRSLFQDAAWRWDVGGSIGCSAFAGRVFRPQGGQVVVGGCSTSPRAETWLTVYRPLHIQWSSFPRVEVIFILIEL